MRKLLQNRAKSREETKDDVENARRGREVSGWSARAKTQQNSTVATLAALTDPVKSNKIIEKDRLPTCTVCGHVAWFVCERIRVPACLFCELREDRDYLEARLTIEDGDCYYCGKPTESIGAANPGLWPVFLCHTDDPGRPKPHHVKCIDERLRELDRLRAAIAVKDEALKQAAVILHLLSGVSIPMVPFVTSPSTSTILSRAPLDSERDSPRSRERGAD